MLGLVHVLILAAHLVAVSIAGTGLLWCVWLEWRGARRNDRLADVVGQRLALDSCHAIVVAAGLGAALFAVSWMRHPHAALVGWRYLLEARPSRLWFTAAEAIFSLALGAGYWWIWRRGLLTTRTRRWAHRVVAIASATNLLYHFPTLFLVIAELNDWPELAQGPYRHLALVARPGVMAALIHTLLANFAVAGAWVAWRAAKQLGEAHAADRQVASDAPAVDAPVATRACQAALVFAGLQLPSGLWRLATMSEGDRTSLLGGDVLGSTLFLLAIAAALGLLRDLADASIGATSNAQARRALGWVIAVVLLMSAARQWSREARLDRRERSAAPTSAVMANGPTLGAVDQARFGRPLRSIVQPGRE